jgi:hypothetical protein
VDDVAEDHLVDLAGVEGGTLDRRSGGGRPQVGWRDVT